ncbi:RNA deprotection pyrophosphohydrolase [Alkalicoccus urumqiensis]|uniref:Nucleoside triphosphatase YtkD n=1 Tax=Alkalicoccus urumqiensis TaxID=1548213 RepID=A0A2P6MGE5_ALKUR|nr:nucleoside triphosphatase YtkD [Alkalicoccus urumqiensis]PRO65349.1 nucleoside triphosphatase YtkD [Alkalicoccus urumqiensis]
MTEKTFQDFYQNQVYFSTDDHPYGSDPRHVWVITRHKGDWLLTKHRSRGMEFPGGKVEAGETAEQAAVREVYEETGGIVRDIHYIGQYRVEGRKETVIKNVYFADVPEVEKKDNYHETRGPRFVQKLPGRIRGHRGYSFIMKDDVLPLSLAEVARRFPEGSAKMRGS